MNFWKIDKEKTKEHWLEVMDPDGWYSAVVRWDGCVHFYRLHNVPLPMTDEHPQCIDYIHYCDLGEEIERLQALREKAKDFFGDDWK